MILCKLGNKPSLNTPEIESEFDCSMCLPTSLTIILNFIIKFNFISYQYRCFILFHSKINILLFVNVTILQISKDGHETPLLKI